MANPNVEKTRASLREAVESQNFDGFDAAYHVFLNQYGLYRKQDTSLTEGVLNFTNPIFGKTSRYHLYSTHPNEADPILARARAASAVMAKLTVRDRNELLRALQLRIEAHQAEIETTITADTGKPISKSHDEMAKGRDWFDWSYANAEGQVGRLNGRRDPMGAVQVIGAYNYPYALAIGGIVGGIAGGNGVIVTAPMKAPHWAFPFMQAAQEAVDDFITQKGITGPDAQALKDGLFQPSFGINNKLTSDADVVHFVGSDTVGHIIERARPGKRTILEMGGTNVVTVLDSAIGAPDKNGKPMTAASIAASIYSGFGPASGQRCTAPRILCVQNGVAQGVIEALGKLCERDFRAHHLGNPFDTTTQMGPLVDAATHQAMQDAMEKAKTMGARIWFHGELTGNAFPLVRTAHWSTPVMIDLSGVPQENMAAAYKLMKHEIFGPLIHVVQPVRDFREAIAFTNRIDDTNKLAGAVYSSDVADTDRLRAEASITSVKHNEPPKDMSPTQFHGHPGKLRIGGGTHFELYTQGTVVQQDHSYS